MHFNRFAHKDPMRMFIICVKYNFIIYTKAVGSFLQDAILAGTPPEFEERNNQNQIYFLITKAQRNPFLKRKPIVCTRIYRVYQHFVVFLAI